MTDRKKKSPKKALDDLVDFAHLSDDAPVDAEAELRSAGVDVSAFLAKVHEGIARVEDEERLAWLRAARETASKPERTRSASKYAGLSRAELEGLVRKRDVGGGEASAYFHKLEKHTEEDLRTLLEDLDDLEDEEPE